MSSQFNTIGIFARVKNSNVANTVRTLITYLQSLNQHILIEEETAIALNDETLSHTKREELCKQCDLLIVVGGDGSLLHAAHCIAGDEIPVIGINRGRLGFLTDIHPNELSKIAAILNGEYTTEKRFLLTANVTLHEQILGSGNALNEVALIPDSMPHMNEFEIYIDEQFVCSQDSDGLIIATPTGSTAYALSGGGPILHPQLNALVLVPMFPHTLTLRPIVISGDSKITIVITPNNNATPRLTCDSQDIINAPPGSHIHIQKKQKPLHLIHPYDYDYYTSLRSKLHWGRKLHYEEI